MPHLSELHGAATHLAVVAIPLYVIVLLCRRAGWGGSALVAAEPWVVGGAVAGTVLAGATGLLVWGQAQTELRGGRRVAADAARAPSVVRTDAGRRGTDGGRAAQT